MVNLEVNRSVGNDSSYMVRERIYGESRPWNRVIFISKRNYVNSKTPIFGWIASTLSADDLAWLIADLSKSGPGNSIVSAFENQIWSSLNEEKDSGLIRTLKIKIQEVNDATPSEPVRICKNMAFAYWYFPPAL